MENTTLRHRKKPKGTTVMLTAYSTVYDSLSSWYRMEGMTQKPHRNRHFSGSRMSADGFRGRVSQVRILPGPLRGFSLGARPERPNYLDGDGVREPALNRVSRPWCRSGFV
jgi:hypothetical protein